MSLRGGERSVGRQARGAMIGARRRTTIGSQFGWPSPLDLDQGLHQVMCDLEHAAFQRPAISHQKGALKARRAIPGFRSSHCLSL